MYQPITTVHFNYRTVVKKEWSKDYMTMGWYDRGKTWDTKTLYAMMANDEPLILAMALLLKGH